ncbi:MAG TPA: pseudouridine synthase [Solirubrobacteraceae bacterium]|nr:pseudouridine synthase [Solirubrobacteraceae bacterium]
MRLAKYLAHAGVASRRGAETMIAAGRVRVGSELVRDPARDVDGSIPVTVDGEQIELSKTHAVYIVNKPAGVVSTAKDTHGRPTVVEIVPTDRRLYPVGRLDADTTGLILLTDDGELANVLTHPRYEVPKTYLAKVSGAPVSSRAVRRLESGVELDDGKTAPATVRQPRPGYIELTIHEGRKGQVRRMCDAVGHPVTALERVAFGPLELGSLKPGRYRRLSPAEVTRLRESGTRLP